MGGWLVKRDLVGFSLLGAKQMEGKSKKGLPYSYLELEVQYQGSRMTVKTTYQEAMSLELNCIYSIIDGSLNKA